MSRHSEEFPLSLTQQDIYFDQLHYGKSPLYNVGGYIRLARCDVPRMQYAHACMVKDHDVFGIRIRSGEDGVCQVVVEDRTTDLPLLDLSTEIDAAEAAKSRIDALFRTPFQTEDAELYRALIVKLADDRYWYVCIAHHLIMDGWGFANLARVLGENYRGHTQADAVSWNEIVASDMRYQESARYEKDRAYWRARCASRPEKLLNRFYEEYFKGIASVSSGREIIAIQPEEYARIRELALILGVGVPQFLMAALVVYFSRTYNQDHIVVGVPAHNRSSHREKEMLGAFTSVSPLFIHAPGDCSFVELTRTIREHQQKDFRHQRYPVGHLTRDLGMSGRNASLYDIGFNYLKLNSFLDIGGEQSELVYLSHHHEATPFILTVWEYGNDLPVELQFDYNHAYFEKTEAAAIAARILGIVRSLLAAGNGDIALSALPRLTGDEVSALHGKAEAIVARSDGDMAVHEAFETQAMSAGDRVALVSQTGSLTYAELNSRANQLAHYLRGKGVGNGHPVGICLRRGTNLLVSVLAVLKTGAAYLPLDPDYPAARLDAMLGDAKATLVLTESSPRVIADRENLQPVFLDDPFVAGEVAGMPDDNPQRSEGFDRGKAAYVMYTSGSTGKPKGVMVTHANLLSYYRAVNEHYEVDTRDTVLQFASCSFDIFVEEVFVCLLSGGKLVLRPDDIVDGGERFWKFIGEQGVTVLCLSTAYWHTLCSTLSEGHPPAETLRLVSVGGEAMSGVMLRRWRACFGEGMRVLNTYGPTECTVVATVFDAAHTDIRRGSVPIGAPLANTGCYILDETRSLCPPGVPGELYLSGGGVAAGYMNQTELTAMQFLPDPFGERGGRLYKTGDLVRMLPDGALDFIGRVDKQVKIRGFRVELGEIEAALLDSGIVKEAVVRAVGAPVELIAYVVFESGDDIVSLKSKLRRTMPDHMIPAAIISVEAIPRTTNGKIDAKSLPTPCREDYVANAYLAPGDDLQAKLATIWADVLKVERVGIDDHFFDIGGNSLLAVELQKAVNSRMGVRMSVTDVFANPTVEAMSSHLSGCIEEQQALITASSTRPQQAHAREDIAIVSMACRFPDANTPEAFWENLCAGKESIQFFTDQELLAAGIPAETLRQANYVKAGIVLPGLDTFDADFFGFTPREAELLDPQQRLLFECAQEALDRAGHGRRNRHNRIGVFMAVGQNRYLFEHLLHNRALFESFGETAVMIANLGDFAATRISNKLDLRGPSVSVHTACSSSLVAVHMACSSLLDGSSDMVLAGGSSIAMLHPVGVLADTGGIASSDGHCRSFDERADGTRPGSGAGIVALRRLGDAIASGDPIIAVIKGSAINNDGADKVGFTAPSVNGQAAVIRDAMLAGGLSSEDIGYIEAHGTGTKLGDPIEIAALHKVFDAKGDVSCAIGSVKPNIGHLDSAAGIAGFIKAAMAVHHGILPPQILFDRPNPEIALDGKPFFINRELSEWTWSPGPRTAGVSSFGIGGTNAHVVIQQAPTTETTISHRDEHLLLLSARSESALLQYREVVAGHLLDNPGIHPADIAYTLQIGRQPHRHRFGVVGRTTEDFIRGLKDVEQPSVPVQLDVRPEIVFVFPGQGAQFPGMGSEIYRQEPVFAACFDACAESLEPLIGLDIRGLILSAPDDEDALRCISQTRIAQPLLFAFEYSLCMQLQAWGIKPDLMIGHSLGEYVAACVAGVLDLNQSLELIAARGRIMQAAPPGMMLSVPLSESDLQPLLAKTGCELAAVNAHDQCVAAGSVEQVVALEKTLFDAGHVPVRLATSHAFHTSMMNSAKDEFLAEATRTTFNVPRVPYVSNLTGEIATIELVGSPDYWARHMVSTVRFRSVKGDGSEGRRRIHLEVGPGSTLGALLKRDDPGASVLRTVRGRRGFDSDEAILLSALGHLWMAGVEIDIAAIHRDDLRRKVTLPTMPFERRRYWVERSACQDAVPAGSETTFYTPQWRQESLSSTEPVAGMDWLVFETGCGSGLSIASALVDRQHRVVVARSSSSPSPSGSTHGFFEFDCSHDPSALKDFVKSRAMEIGRVVVPDLRNEDRQSDAEEDALACRERFMAVLAAFMAVIESGPHPKVHIDVVSRHASSVTGMEGVRADGAVVSGICRVAPQEFPWMTVRQIDIDDFDSQRNHVICEIESPSSTPSEVAYRGAHRWERLYSPLSMTELAKRRSLLKEGGVYMITGGLGRIGLALADFLGRNYRAKLVLIGRSAFPDRSMWESAVQDVRLPASTRDAISMLLALEVLGAEVAVLSADVADEARMQTVVSVAEMQFGAIDGVIHCAGDVAQSVVSIPDLTIAELDSQFKAKVTGVNVIDKIIRQKDVDFCLLMSSLSSVLGGLGLAAYSAANAYMDAFVQRKRNIGDKRWIAVNWDGWDFDDGSDARQRYRHSMSPTHGVRLFTDALRVGGPQQMVNSNGDIESRLRKWVQREDSADEQRSAFLAPRRLSMKDYVAPRFRIEIELAEIWQRFLGVEMVGVNDDFFTLGGDSLLLTRVLAEINRKWQVNLPIKVVFEKARIADLALVLASMREADCPAGSDEAAVEEFV